MRTPAKTPNDEIPRNGEPALTKKATAVVRDVNNIATDALLYTSDILCARDLYL